MGIFYSAQQRNLPQLKKISEFYQIPKNKGAIDRSNQKIRIFDFYSGKETNITDTKAKVVDMIGFIEGQRSSSKNE